MKATSFFAIFLSINVYGQQILLAKNNISGEEHFETRFIISQSPNGEILSVDKIKYDTEKEEIIKVQHIPFEELENGVVIENRKGFDVISIKGYNLSSAIGGSLTITYLQNAVLENFQELHLKLEKEDGLWTLKDKNDQYVKEIFLNENWMIFIGTIGIDSIDPIPHPAICSEKFSNPC